jgi:thymidylate synthase (FAD)
MMKKIELIGRVCYKSEDKITADSADKRVRGWIEKGHEAMLEHAIISVKLTCDRGVTHEVVRHRLDSFAQESTRYCNYGTDKFDGQVTFIKPFFWNSDGDTFREYELWRTSCLVAEDTYLTMLNKECSPQEARDVLPNSLKTEIWWTANLREWRHIFGLRAAKPAHPQMRQLMIPTRCFLGAALPAVFDSIPYDEDFPVEHMAKVNWVELSELYSH